MQKGLLLSSLASSSPVSLEECPTSFPNDGNHKLTHTERLLRNPSVVYSSAQSTVSSCAHGARGLKVSLGKQPSNVKVVICHSSTRGQQDDFGCIYIPGLKFRILRSGKRFLNRVLYELLFKFCSKSKFAYCLFFET